MEQDHWYCFNDTRVEVAKKEDIEKSFGGSAGGWSYGNQNAYMLMYRKVDIIVIIISNISKVT